MAAESYDTTVAKLREGFRGAREYPPLPQPPAPEGAGVLTGCRTMARSLITRAVKPLDAMMPRTGASFGYVALVFSFVLGACGGGDQAEQEALALRERPAALTPAPVTITSYDISEAVESGFGGWSHSFAGTIAPVRPFTLAGNSGTVANYTNGSGTLNDGVIGTDLTTTQLFVQGPVDDASTITPRITLKLGVSAKVTRLLISGGEFGTTNIYPGILTGVRVTIGGQSQVFATIDTGSPGALQPVDDIVDLTGSPLADIAADTIVLDQFSIGFGLDQFAISEITVEGTPASMTIEATIDVKPRTTANRIYLGGATQVKVAVLSTATVNAASIAADSLTFGRTGTEASLVRCRSMVDVNRDGRKDLLCEFSIAASALQAGDATAKLAGTLKDGTAFAGSDTVQVFAPRYGRGDTDEDGDQ